MKNFMKIVTVLLLALSSSAFAKPIIELYKSPTCSCCKKWAAIMEKEGYTVNVHLQNEWNSVKESFGLRPQLQSCHSAVIDGYLVEGHVPPQDVARLLKERPLDIKGIAAPGMPQYSPGMAADEEYKEFNVIAFSDKSMSVYHKY
jgi:hypothetical protein